MTDCWVNHKGPSHTTSKTNVDALLDVSDMQPLVFKNQRDKDYIDALSMMMGKPIETLMWDDEMVLSNMFFTFVIIPDLWIDLKLD